MKKGWKIFWIFIACIGGLGLVLTIFSLFLGFSYKNIFYELPYFKDHLSKENLHYITDYDTNKELPSTLDETGLKGFISLELDVDYGEIILLPSPNDEIYIDTKKCSDNFPISVNPDGKRLSITCDKPSSVHLGKHHKYPVLYIYVPVDSDLQYLSVTLNAGEVEAENLKIKNIAMNISAGECSLEEIIADNLSAEISTGEFDLEGTIKNDLVINCSTGEVDVTLHGNETDYNYSLMSGVGTVKVGKNTYTGLSTEQKCDNNSSKNITLNCNLGEIELDFE